jgi:hypothetical protein
MMTVIISNSPISPWQTAVSLGNRPVGSETMHLQELRRRLSSVSHAVIEDGTDQLG